MDLHIPAVRSILWTRVQFGQLGGWTSDVGVGGQGHATIGFLGIQALDDADTTWHIPLTRIENSMG
jgi:hypothetical protein